MTWNVDVFFLLVIVCASLPTSLYAKNKYDVVSMQDNCGLMVVLDPTETREVKLTSRHSYAPRNCSVTFSVRGPKRLQLKFKSLDIANVPFQECKDKLEIFSMYSTEKRRIGTYCGQTIPSEFPVEVDMNTMRLEFTSTGVQSTKTGFTAFITPFHEGYCEANAEISCTNHKCIAENLVCDGYDNCGDNSDEASDVHNCKSSMLDGLLSWIHDGSNDEEKELDESSSGSWWGGLSDSYESNDDDAYGDWWGGNNYYWWE